ncbi:MAG: Lrp/AsnC family transcriptional regulator [Fimbriimonas sp.]
MLDEFDLKILAQLQDDARIANAEIARRIGMAPSAVLERVRRLEERGVILGYEARLSPESLGLGLTAFISVRTNLLDATEQMRQLADIPEVLELHDVAGDDCFLIKVRVKDTQALGRLTREQIGVVPGVTATRTTIVLQTAKESNRSPLPKERR